MKYLIAGKQNCENVDEESLRHFYFTYFRTYL